MAQKPAIYDITIYQGSDFNLSFTWKDSTNNPISLSNYSAAMQCRLNKDSPATIFSLTELSGITLEPSGTGTVSIDIDAATTGGYTFKEAFYDLELTDPTSKVRRLMEGKVYLSKQVTK